MPLKKCFDVLDIQTLQFFVILGNGIWLFQTYSLQKCVPNVLIVRDSMGDVDCILADIIVYRQKDNWENLYFHAGQI